MKSVVAIVLGLVIAFAIACGGAAKPAYRETAPPPRGGGLGVAPRAEIDQLDAAITADMEKLAAPRPDPAPGACVDAPLTRRHSFPLAARLAVPGSAGRAGGILGKPHGHHHHR